MHNVSTEEFLKRYSNVIDSLSIWTRVNLGIYLVYPCIQLVFQNIHHLLESILVERMCDCFSFSAPTFIPNLKDECVWCNVLKGLLPLASLVDILILCNEHILNHRWVADIQNDVTNHVSYDCFMLLRIEHAIIANMILYHPVEWVSKRLFAALKCLCIFIKLLCIPD